MSVEMQATKWLSVAPPTAIKDDETIPTTEIDSLGYNYLTVWAYIGATDIAMAACKLQESSTSGSGFADFGAMDTNGDTSASGVAATLPTATDDNKFVLFEVDLRGRERYFDLVLTAGDGTSGTFCCAGAVLSRGNVSPGNVTADRGDVVDVMRSP